jgi:asparagine synthase (glutamine-hydrolysing)
MCGIVAVFDSCAASHPATALEAVRRGVSTLHHRGPDSQNDWNSIDGLVSLGRARLSIIDLAGGDQPLANEDESVHAIVNGEFYDFERIRARLQSHGHCFRTRSDSEILLHLYEDFGVECVHHLRGEFAFVLWDSRRHLLFAARDRFGIKPLFYSESRGRPMLASEVKALHAAGVPAAWDDQGFADTLAFLITPPRSLFRGVSSLPPGHYMVARDSGVSTRRYWDWDFAREDEMPPARPEREYIEEFRSLLDDAVNTRLRADVPVGCYLSGGIDSCSVLALMAQHAPGRVRAFSLGFDHSMYDEGPIAREMAARTGAEFTLIPISHADMARDLSDALWHCESFFINGNSAAKFALSRAVRDAGYKVVLTGEGSDEVLAGYAFFAWISSVTRTPSRPLPPPASAQLRRVPPRRRRPCANATRHQPASCSPPIRWIPRLDTSGARAISPHSSKRARQPSSVCSQLSPSEPPPTTWSLVFWTALTSPAR